MHINRKTQETGLSKHFTFNNDNQTGIDPITILQIFAVC